MEPERCKEGLAETYMAHAGISKLHLYAVVASKEAAQRERDLLKREVVRLREALRGIARLEHVAAADSAVNAAGRDAREALER